MRFVDWEPSFAPDGDDINNGDDGLVWLYDAEGERLLRCTRDRCDIIAAALEYALSEIIRLYGAGWGNLSDDLAEEMLRRNRITAG